MVNRALQLAKTVVIIIRFDSQCGDNILLSVKITPTSSRTHLLFLSFFPNVSDSIIVQCIYLANSQFVGVNRGKREVFAKVVSERTTAVLKGLITEKVRNCFRERKSQHTTFLPIEIIKMIIQTQVHPKSTLTINYRSGFFEEIDNFEISELKNIDG